MHYYLAVKYKYIAIKYKYFAAKYNDIAAMYFDIIATLLVKGEMYVVNVTWYSTVKAM